jgi:hypothetical protein
MSVDSTAATLTGRIDALAAALRAAGVPPERSAGLLAAAAAATMHAVMLSALLDEPLQPERPLEPVAVIEPPAAPISLAA